MLAQVHPQLFIMEVDRKRGRTARQSYQYVDVLTGMVELSQNGEPLFAIHRRHASRKTQGCYRELTPTLEYIRKEQKQEKPSIRDQLKAAARTQPENKSPAKSKGKDLEL